MLLGIIDMLAVNISGWYGPASISIAEKWHILVRMRRRFGECAMRARAESLPASHNIWKRRGKEKKTTKSRQALRIQSGPSVVHKNHFLPKALLR